MAAEAIGISKESRKILDKIPDGIESDRPGAPRGAYGTSFAGRLQEADARLRFLRSKVFGIQDLMSSASKLQAAEAIYLLEAEIVRLMLDISQVSDTAISTFEKEASLQSTVDLYKDLAVSRDRYFENMVRFIDKKIPGPNGIQIRKDISKQSIYLPGYRSDTALSSAAQQRAYKKKRQEFFDVGGSFNERETIGKALASNEQVLSREYVILPGGKIRTTSGKMGHILLAEGKPVLAAGQFLIVRSAKGRPLMLVLTNASGNYKPDMYSVQNTIGAKLRKLLNISPYRVVYTKGEPLSSQFYRISAKGLGLPTNVITQSAKSMEKTVRTITNVSCSAYFSRISR